MTTSQLSKEENKKKLFVLEDNKLKINPKTAVEFETTYGIPTELFKEWVEKRLNEHKGIDRLEWVRQNCEIK